MIDAVLSYHMNPQTCGVAKFNHALAERLGVPCLSWETRAANSLLSVKSDELRCHASDAIQVPCKPFDVMMHDDGWQRLEFVLDRARTIYAANGHIASTLREVWPNKVVECFCPSTVTGTAHRGGYRVLAFGMAHKLILPHFERLREELTLTHPDYTIELSTAVHEGNPWDVALTESVEAMRGIFGDKLRVLGFLGDDALAKELHDVDAVAAFYTPALRANNTTYWAAVDAGKTIYTNRDEHSPKEGDPPASWDRLCALIQGAA